MNYEDVPRPHPAVVMEGCVWHGTDCVGFTAMCLNTHELGFAGRAECVMLRYAENEERMRTLAVHMLNNNCGWSHRLI